MPVATITKSAERFELKNLPEGYVIVRRMTYGEKLTRQDEMLRMRTGEGNSLEMQMFNRKTALSDFANLLIDHNLTDENERKLNFKDPQDVLRLDPVIGEEIGSYIDKVNGYEGTSELKN